MIKTGRNDPCPCGSGNKYKRCCMDSNAKQRNEFVEELEHKLAMNPDLSLDELNLIAEQLANDRNSLAMNDFCGLSPNQIQNWLYAPVANLTGVTISTPADFSDSPVMRYLELIIDTAMEKDGKFKATPKGNLPTSIVKAATGLRSELTTSDSINISISEFAGSNEDKFNALHYTRILAEIAGIIYRRSGYYHVKKTAQKQYLQHGLGAFFIPMLEAAVSRYNWHYFDSFEDESDVRLFWIFMLWRLQNHRSVEQMVAETATAFPDIMRAIPHTSYASREEMLSIIIESRFIERFLTFWGFVQAGRKRFMANEKAPRNVQLQPLFEQTFRFSV